MSFCKDFAWGTATAAYQIEGAWNDDGRGPSIWDIYCHTPGRTWKGDSGDTACDHYHCWREDIALMKKLGIKAYRFSLSWPRILPSGEGKPSERGIMFYERLIDSLLAAGIEPWVTLYHWDLPYELYCRGGWLNPEMPNIFSAYTRTVVDRFSDRVTRWMTLNEPQCFIGLGLERGNHAPGLQLSRQQVLRAAHHTLLAHGRAVQIIRDCAKKPPAVGLATVGVTAFPLTESLADIEVARKGMFSHEHRDLIVNSWDDTCVWSNTWWGDPIVFGRYPEDAVRAFGADMPAFTEDEMQTISAPIDFWGTNIYHGVCLKAGADGGIEKISDAPGCPRTLFSWAVSPKSLYWGPRFLFERYKLPIVVAENGMSSPDWVDLDGKVNDFQRIDFTRRYLAELKRAVVDGVDIRGYFHWSLLDNLEWGEGFKQRFGLIHVDFETLRRTPKQSYYWYRDVIATNGQSL